MEGDEEEDGIDDIENEFSFEGSNNEQHHFVVHREPQLSLLSNGHKVLLPTCNRNHKITTVYFILLLEICIQYLLSHLCSHFCFFILFPSTFGFPHTANPKGFNSLWLWKCCLEGDMETKNRKITAEEFV